jgi:thiosulfate dehydrogenase [quinone] large subunit
MLLPIFDAALGPVLILSGITLLLGIATRYSLFVMGLIYTSLTLGLILIGQNSGVAWLGIHLMLVVMMLDRADNNKFEITGRWKV